MSTVKNRSASKKLVYTLILLFVFFLFIEIVLSVFLYHRNSSEKLATVEALKLVKKSFEPVANPVNVPNQVLVRPDSSEAISRQIAEETHQSNRFIYQPWIEFRNIDFAGRYVNIQDGIRKSVPNSHIVPSTSDTLDVYMFGGSTMFGFNVSDAESIPSQLVKLIAAKEGIVKSLRITNFATPTYYSGQEAVQFSQLVLAGHKPDMVIFLDGVNDFWFARASYYNQSYFSFLFRQVLNPSIALQESIVIKDSSAQMYLTPPGIDEIEFNSKLIENYYANMKKSNMLADRIGAKIFFFCQPVPFYKYPGQQKDPICFKDQDTRFNKIYPIIEKDSSKLVNFTFLGNMLENEQGYPFVDGLHYSPSFNTKVAERIFQKIEANFH